MLITLKPSKQAINGDCTCTFNEIVYFHGPYQHTTPHTTVEMTTCKNSHSTNSAVGNLLLQCIWVTWDNKYQIFCLYYSLLNMLQPREAQKWRLSSGAVAGRVSHGVKHIWWKFHSNSLNIYCNRWFSEIYHQSSIKYTFFSLFPGPVFSGCSRSPQTIQ